MSKINVGLTTEFPCSNDKPFEWVGTETTEIGYQCIEPMVHFGRELMSGAGYLHTVSLFDVPYRIKYNTSPLNSQKRKKQKFIRRIILPRNNVGGVTYLETFRGNLDLLGVIF